MTAEELHLVVAEAQTAGVLEESERAIISGIVRLADRPVREVMTPRTEVDWIDINCTPRANPRDLREFDAQPPPGRRRVGRQYRRRDPRPRYAHRLARRPQIDLRRTVPRKAPVIPDLMDAMDALAVLRGADVPLALVHDEYGHLDGIVTPGSILAALAGAFAHDIDDDDDPPLVERDDGSWLVSGAASADLLIGSARRATCRMTATISTVAGFALSVLKHLPETGEKLQARRLDVRDRRHGRPQDRQVDRLPPPRRKRDDDAQESAG